MGVTREIAAHHEAGHAVVALAFCATGLHASIKRRGTSAGRVAHDPLPKAADVMLLITLAGPFAHRRFAPRSNWFGGSDFAIVQKMIFGKGSSGTATNKEKYLARADGRPSRQSGNPARGGPAKRGALGAS